MNQKIDTPVTSLGSETTSMIRQMTFHNSYHLHGFCGKRLPTKDHLDYNHAVEVVIGYVNDGRLRIELLNTKACTEPDYMKGIGQFPVLSLTTLTAVCVIDTISIKLQFHILPDYEMPQDILVGINLIHSTDLSMVITSSETRLIRQQSINHVSTRNLLFERLESDLTKDDENLQLQGLLNKYEHLFSRGYPKTRVNTGSIQAQFHLIQKTTAAFQFFHMDITGKLGTQSEQQYVIVTIDAFSKYVLLYHATNKSPHSTLAALKRTVNLFGIPVQIIVDGGNEILGEFQVYCENIGINIHAI